MISLVPMADKTITSDIQKTSIHSQLTLKMAAPYFSHSNIQKAKINVLTTKQRIGELLIHLSKHYKTTLTFQTRQFQVYKRLNFVLKICILLSPLQKIKSLIIELVFLQNKEKVRDYFQSLTFYVTFLIPVLPKQSSQELQNHFQQQLALRYIL